MTPRQVKWGLFVLPALIIGGFETLRHSLFSELIPLGIGNWITALMDALIIALISRRLFQLFEKNERELSSEREWRAVLEERERLAREMHDQIAQSIFYTGVQVQSIQKQAHQMTAAQTQDALSNVLVSLREMDENIRQAIFNLKQPPLYSPDFFGRVRSYLSDTLGVNGINWETRVDPDFPILSASEQLHLFGILQEAVTNIVKHSRARFVSITLTEASPLERKWAFQIEDNGVGFEFDSIKGHHFGFDIIANRAGEIGATAVVESDPKLHQTRISVRKI